jgi:diguanylate cyclase (GGDEF)-like protein
MRDGMGAPLSPRRAVVRQFAIYAAITFLPVFALGVVLAITFRGNATDRGLAEGRSQAVLIAQAALEPQLDGRTLGAGLSAAEQERIERLVGPAVREGHVLRLRLRSLVGRVVYSDDGSGFGDKPEDDALRAARGKPVIRLTDLNADSNDRGHRGVASVEIYLPLSAGIPAHRVGVLEIYLPFAPIARDVTAGLQTLYLDLALGLAGLYLLLFAITASVSRGLRREVAINAFLAHHDTLTDLPNRALFLKRAAAAVAQAGRSRQPVAIAIIDLDHFKDINDTLGHQSGDQLLTELARRVNASMRPGDTVARLGGDEFGLILCGITEPEPALLRLCKVIERDVEVRGLPLSVQPSIGFVIAGDAGTSIDTLLQHADVAMYAAKAQHAGVVRYIPELDHYDAANLSLVGELRHAISDGELVLHYQPQANIAQGGVEAVEALVRWKHPTQGLLYPDRFLPLAEQTDLIDKLTEWVLATALVEIQRIGGPGSELAVAVNVSARSLGRTEFAGQIIQALQDHDLAPERLIIEVTETALLTDPARAARVLAELAAAGVRISLDDFGCGQTSLGYLSALPVHELKIDRSFVMDMHDNAAHAAIVRSIIDLGHNLSMRVVAEGIETEDVLTTLRGYDCDLAQGYWLARPMPAEDLDPWLARARQDTKPPVTTIELR